MKVYNNNTSSWSWKSGIKAYKWIFCVLRNTLVTRTKCIKRRHSRHTHHLHSVRAVAEISDWLFSLECFSLLRRALVLEPWELRKDLRNWEEKTRPDAVSRDMQKLSLYFRYQINYASHFFVRNEQNHFRRTLERKAPWVLNLYRTVHKWTYMDNWTYLRR